MQRSNALSGLAIALVMLSGMAVAGPLNPPAGPIAPSPGPEPRIAINATNTPGDSDATPSVYKITQTGSYYLSGNIDVLQPKIAIEVAASDVTIDLNGFAIEGNAVGTTGVYVANGSYRGLRVRNGTIAWFTGYGIAAEPVKAVVLSDLTIRNTPDGARIGDDARVTDCIFDSNSYLALKMAGGGVLERCTAIAGGTGFSVQGWAVIRDCVAKENTGDGFTLLFGGTVTACVASNNASDGFWLQGGTTISDCHTLSNDGVGIFANGGCIVKDNVCSGDGVGIEIHNSANRVEANNVSSCTTIGISSPGDNNFIVRNTCRNNPTNYSIPAGEFAQIITNPGNAFSSTQPWANFAY